MGDEAIDALGSAFDVYSIGSYLSVEVLPTELWNGRAVERMVGEDVKLRMITQVHLKAIQEFQEAIDGEHQYEVLDLEEESDSYIEFTYCTALDRSWHGNVVHFDLRGDAADISECKNLLKSAAKGVKKCTKHVVKGVKKGAKEVAAFVKEHKTELLIVVAVVAVGVGAYLIAGAAATGAAGAEGVDGTSRRREDEDDIPPEPPEDREPSPTPTPSSSETRIGIVDTHVPDDLASQLHSGNAQAPIKASSFSLPQVGDPTIAAGFVPDLGDGTNEWPSTAPGFFPGLGTGANVFAFAAPGLRNATTLHEPEPARSCYVRTEGVQSKTHRIGFINGMNTSFPGFQSHLDYIKQFAGDLAVEGVYNHSNSPLIDVIEIFTCNYPGIAPGTAPRLQDNWRQFHEENHDNPEAKYFQVCYSQGTIELCATLLDSPQEIRDRIIVVALGAAKIIPKDLCYKSFNYASEKDLVHYGENVFVVTMAAFNDEEEHMMLLNQLAESKAQLILLPPHEKATGIDHSFQSLTFADELEKHIRNYLDSGEQE